jgi:hypothetical protein
MTRHNTLRNVIGPILQAINSAMSVAQQIMGAIFDFQWVNDRENLPAQVDSS